jgi:hypothetical protein
MPTTSTCRLSRSTNGIDQRSAGVSPATGSRDGCATFKANGKPVRFFSSSNRDTFHA